MRLHFGIDMATNLDGGELTRVANALQAPVFVGRYLPVFSVSPAEITYLLSRGGSLACIDNEDQTGSQMQGSYMDGTAHGVRAALRWKTLGCPAGVAIYLDVEQTFAPSGEYLAGFVDGVYRFGYIGGVYLNSIAGIGHNNAYNLARKSTTHAIPIWASEPEPLALANRVATAWEPAAPAGWDSAVVLWQYCINFGQSDLDLATDAGLALMWGAPKQKMSVRVGAALKSQPNHISLSAIGPDHRPVMLTRNEIVVPTGTVTGEWTELRLPNSPVHGWYLTTNLQIA